MIMLVNIYFNKLSVLMVIMLGIRNGYMCDNFNNYNNAVNFYNL